MPRQSKSKTEVTETTTAVTNNLNTIVVEQQASPVTKPKKTVTKKQDTETVTTTTPVVVAPVVDVAVDTVEGGDAELVAQSNEFLAKLNQLGALIGSLKVEYRTLEKRWSRELKTAQKSQAKRKRKSGNRAPSGFVKPTKISDELAKFLEKPTGSEMARTDVTREINKYIRSHNLQDKENGRKINPDVKLQTLLKLKKTDELTYFNLQRYMSPHFSKTEKTVTA
jgi:upstream activation factor subunit UAF30